jgi:hypothetical protein
MIDITDGGPGGAKCAAEPGPDRFLGGNDLVLADLSQPLQVASASRVAAREQLTARRLKLVVAESAETETIERILRKRLRMRRERRGALDRRQVEQKKRAGWIAAKVLLNAGNPNDLIKALRSGAVDCLFVHPTRWWLKPSTVPQTAWDGAQFKNGELWRNGICLEGRHQQLVINEQQWRERLGKPPPDKTQSKLRDATDDDIRIAMRAVYDEARARNEKAPNVKQIVSPVRKRLETGGCYVERNRVDDIAGENEFKNRRERPGPTQRNRKRQTK